MRPCAPGSTRDPRAPAASGSTAAPQRAASTTPRRSSADPSARRSSARPRRCRPSSTLPCPLRRRYCGECEDADVGVMLDHLVYGTPDVSAATEDLAGRLGVRAVLGGRHDGAGTYNTLAGLGSGSDLGVMGPAPEQPRPAGPRPSGVDALDGPRLSGWALRGDVLGAALADARADGDVPGPAMAMSRTRPDGVTGAWRR